jgi:hypothetical protein
LLALGRTCTVVRDCLEPSRIIDADASLFAAIPIIVENECVLIKDHTGIICGIVTPADLSLQFRQLGEPFLLLGEIENYVRRMIGAKFSIAELQAARDPADSERPVEDVSDLTLGEYIRLLEDPRRWNTLGFRVDRGQFMKLLNRIRVIRNDVMHFDPDGIEPDEIQELRDFVHFLQTLADCNVI